MNKRPHQQEKPKPGRRVAVGTSITEREAEDVEERATPRTPVIYEVVRRMGEEEMARPAVSLWWSGVAAGLSISFSLLGQAILQIHLPDAPWRPLVTSLGYSVGFVMVVLARQQLFTENTITVVLPVLAELTIKNLLRLCQMWAIVLLANIAGTLAAAVLCTYTPVLAPELRDAMLAVRAICSITAGSKWRSAASPRGSWSPPWSGSSPAPRAPNSTSSPL